MIKCPFNKEKDPLNVYACDAGLTTLEWFTCLRCIMFAEYVQQLTNKPSNYIPTVKFSDNGDMTTVSVPIRKEELESTLPPDKISEFDTGGLRSSDENKTLWDLIPVECLERLAIKYTDGAKIYGKHNWKKGIPTERYVSGALRHFMQWRLGQRDEDHLAACVFNLFGIMFNELAEKEYPYKKEK